MKDDVCNEESMKGMEAMLTSLTKMMGEEAESNDDVDKGEEFNPAQMAKMMKEMGIDMPPTPQAPSSKPKPAE